MFGVSLFVPLVYRPGDLAEVDFFQILADVAGLRVKAWMFVMRLMHSGRDAGLGGMGFTPQSQGGTHIVERNLTRYTLIVAVLFVANSIALFHYLK